MMKPNKFSKYFRNVFIRISAKNKIHEDNILLGLKKGDIVEYTKDDIKDILDKWTQTKPFNYYFIEHNHNSEYAHFHIVITFYANSIATFDSLKAKFPYGDIECCKYGVKSCIQYLVHMNNSEKTQYDWSEVVTNALDKLENYKIPGKANMDAKAKNIIDKILSGELKECDINKIDPDIYIQYNRKIKNAFEYRNSTLQLDTDRNIQVIALIGKPRTGKSTFAKVYAEKNNKSIYFTSSSNDIMCNYLQQSCVCIDDWNYSSMKIEDTLKMIDPHRQTAVASRYHNKLLVADTIIFASNIPIQEWYKNEPLVLREAFLKRISCVLEFTDSEVINGISHYTVNKIDTDNMCLVPIDDKVREFNLNKYINVDYDNNRADEFVQQLDEI